MLNHSSLKCLANSVYNKELSDLRRKLLTCTDSNSRMRILNRIEWLKNAIQYGNRNPYVMKHR